MDFIRSEGIAERQHLIWGIASSLSIPRTYRGVKSNLRKAVGNLELHYGCEITVIAQEGLNTCYTRMLYKLIKVIAQEGLKHVY